MFGLALISYLIGRDKTQAEDMLEKKEMITEKINSYSFPN